jgi:hypothetical protein
MTDADYGLALPFDSDEPEFRRGVEIGMLWAGLVRDGYAEASVHADCAEMIIRIAEATGLPFTADPVGDDWLHVTIGREP